MIKIKRFVVLFIVFLSSVLILNSCMVTRSVMPEGLEQAIEGFDIFIVEIREVNYFVASNTLSISLTLNLDRITQEDASQLLSVLTEYFRTEQFAEFVEEIQEIDDGYFSIRLNLFNANNEREHLTSVTQSGNFEDWSAGFEYMWQNGD